MAVYRGTTPALILNVTGNDFSDAVNVYVTLEQEDVEITKTGADIVIAPGDEADSAVITVFYTQEDMLKLLPAPAYIQIRWTDSSDEVLASPIKKLTIHDILLEGEI